MRRHTAGLRPTVLQKQQFRMKENSQLVDRSVIGALGSLHINDTNHTVCARISFGYSGERSLAGITPYSIKTTRSSISRFLVGYCHMCKVVKYSSDQRFPKMPNQILT